MAHSAIEWTESSWNPVTGCTKISQGCKQCYAEKMARRLHAMGQPNYRNGFKVTLHPHMLNRPLQWRRPQRIFVNSMSDLFHELVPIEFILRAFDVMRKATWHYFQVLTKRTDRLREIDNHIDWPSNVWMGATVESAEYAFRIADLRRSGAQIKFLSLEPLLGPIPKLDLTDIDWVIVGGESGSSPRPIREEWVLSLLDRCQQAQVPFFFKQWGGRNKKKAGRLLRGRTWDQMPSPKTCLNDDHCLA
jgi:protein gp37